MTNIFADDRALEEGFCTEVRDLSHRISSVRLSGVQFCGVFVAVRWCVFSTLSEGGLRAQSFHEFQFHFPV